MPPDTHFVLALSGGNALAAYQAGVIEALIEAGMLPEWVCAGSAGAVNGALLAGNPPEQAIERLAAFWRPGAIDSAWFPSIADELRRTAAVTWTLAAGEPQAFTPRPPFAWDESGSSSLFDTRPLLTSLASLVDFDRLNTGPMRFTATAVDLESGEDVIFDTVDGAITPDHVRASCALTPVFQPVEIDGRLLADTGLSANLPLDPVLRDPPAGRTLCLAVDLLPLAGPRPDTLTDLANRTQDLLFAAQSRRTIAAWQALFDARGSRAEADQPSVTLLHLTYAAQGREVAGKAFDFSPVTIRERWDAGLRDTREVLARLGDGLIALGRPGLTVHHLAPGTESAGSA